MKKSITMFDFFKRKYSNSFEVNIGLPTTNVTIPIPKNNHISQIQFQKVDLDSLDYDLETRKEI